MSDIRAPEKTAAPCLDVATLVADVRALLATEVFSSVESSGPLFRAAFVWLILNVSELLQEADRLGRRVVLVEEGSEDVTDLIARARYAIVHMAGGAKRRRATSARLDPEKRVLVGEASGHADDIAVDLGTVQVRIRRDVVRAFEAACAALER